MNSMNLLRFENLRVTLGAGEAGETISGSLPQGKILAVRGPSGAGKTTLLRVLGRLEDRFAGRIYWKGRPLEKVPAAEWRRNIQYIHQDPVTFPGTVRTNLLQAWELSAFRNHLRPETEKLVREMADLGLDADLLDRDSQILSGGEKARLVLLRHLLSGPDILLLDEPTASLDPENRDLVLKKLMSWLNEDSGRGLCLVSHADDHRSFPQGTVMEITLNEKGKRS